MTIFLDAHWFHAVSIDGIEKIAKPLFNLEFDEGNIANVIESWMNKWTNKADSADSFIRSLVKVSDVLTEVIFLNFFFRILRLKKWQWHMFGYFTILKIFAEDS